MESRIHRVFETVRKVNIKTGIIALLYALFFSFAFAASFSLRFSGDLRGDIRENTLNMNYGAVPLIMALGIVMFVLVLVLSDYCRNHNLIISEDVKREKKTDSGKVVWIYWLIISVCWIPYILTWYPGGIVGDGAWAIEEALRNGLPVSTHWGVLHVLLLKACLTLGYALNQGDYVMGIFLYALFQTLIMSFVCAEILCWMRKERIRKIFIYLTMLIYSVSFFFVSYGMALWKDGLFACGILAWVLKLNSFSEAGEEKETPAELVKYGLLLVFIALWRNNGLVVVILTTLIIQCFWGKKHLKRFFAGMAAVLLAFVIQNYIYVSFGIMSDAEQEGYSVPIQQIAATLSEGYEPTEEQAEVLYSILPREEWISTYSPMISDDLKANPQIDGDYFRAHKSDFLKVWAEILPGHFVTYVKSYMLLTAGFWQPTKLWIGHYCDYWDGIQDVADRGWENINILQKLTGIDLRLVNNIIYYFIPSGIMVWIMWLSFVIRLINGGGKDEKLILYIPFIICWLTVMLSTPIAYMYRYVYMLALGFPVLMTLPLVPYKGNPKDVC